MKVTLRKFGELENVSRQRVSQWVREGIVTLDHNGKIDVDQAREELEKNLDHAKRIDWEITFNKEKFRPSEIGKPEWASGNGFRDFQTLAILHFYDWMINQMASIMLSLLKHCNVADISAKSLVILDSIKRGELVKEYITQGVFEKEMGQSLDEVWRPFVKNLKSNWRKDPPKSLMIYHPTAIQDLLKEEKVYKHIMGDEKKAKNKGHDHRRS